MFAHLALVLGPDHTPLSKRHGATSVSEFRHRGYLPEALVNYLALLGWSPGGGDELLPASELARRFALDHVGHSAAVFDIEKLSWVNRHYLRDADAGRLTDLAMPYFAEAGFVRGTPRRRGRTSPRSCRSPPGPSTGSSRCLTRLRFLFDFDPRRALELAEVQDVLKEPGARAVIAALASELASEPRLDRERFRAAAGRVRQATGRKGKELFHPIRVAITGEAGGPELDLAVPAIDGARSCRPSSGVAPILGCRERAALVCPGVRRGVGIRRQKTGGREGKEGSGGRGVAGRVRPELQPRQTRNTRAPPGATWNLPASNRRQWGFPASDFSQVLGVMLIYGINPVLEALRAGRVREVRMDRAGRDRMREIRATADAQGVPVRLPSAQDLERRPAAECTRVSSPSVADAPDYSVQELVAAAQGAALLVVLDGIEDPHNVGAILRTVDAAGGHGIVRQARHAARLDGAAAKTSAGAVAHVKDRQCRQHRPCPRRTEGGRRVDRGAGRRGARDLRQGGLRRSRRPSSSGLRAQGLRRLVRESCDRLASIPMRGHVESLNVSVAAAVVLFEAVRQRRARTIDVISRYTKGLSACRMAPARARGRRRAGAGRGSGRALRRLRDGTQRARLADSSGWRSSVR